MWSHNLTLAEGNIDGNKTLFSSDGHRWSWLAMDGQECYGWDCQGLNLNCTSHFTVISIWKETNFLAQFTQTLL
jgi:hypothetical protein